MTVIHLLIVLVVLGAVAALVAGKVRGGLPEPTATRPDLALPTTDIAPADIDAVRFSVGFRGYRMDEVDDVLDRLSADLADRDRAIEQLRDQVAELAGGPEIYQRPVPAPPAETPLEATSPPDTPPTDTPPTYTPPTDTP